MKTETANKRDITQALDIVNAGRNVDEPGAEPGVIYTLGQRADLRRLLSNLDARTGTRDPSVKKAAKKKARR